MPPGEECSLLRDYLLGRVDSDEIATAIEERLMTDADYYDQFLAVEEELAQEHVDGHLSRDEADRFDRHYLVSAERRKKVLFAAALRESLNRRSDARQPRSGLRRKPFSLRWLASPIPAAAALLTFLSGIAVLVYVATRDSEVDRAMAALNSAYRTERPTEERISAFDYAPYRTTRGDPASDAGRRQRALAERLLLDEVSRSRTAENLHAYGMLRLAEGKIDEAIANLEEARRLAPSDPEILSDLAVAHLQKGKSAAVGEDVENYSKALDLLDRSIEIRPAPPALFNKALCLQLLNLRGRARRAWEVYIESDPSSAWAEEARRNLERISEQNGADDLGADDLERRFDEAVMADAAGLAYRLFASNRELIREKYLPQRLAFSISGETPRGRRDVALRSLRYLAAIDASRSGDRFAAELAGFFSTNTPRELELTRRGHAAMRRGYADCLRGDFASALLNFGEARRSFDAAGNRAESLLALHFAAYCVYNTNRIGEALRLWQENHRQSERNKFKWLALSDLYWIGSAQDALGRYADSRATFTRSLAIAEALDDPYHAQRINLALASQAHSFGDGERAMLHAGAVMRARGQGSTLRQIWRNNDEIANILTDLKLFGAANAVTEENIQIADEMADPLFAVGSRINAAIVSLKRTDPLRAGAFLDSAGMSLAGIPEPATRAYYAAHISLLRAQREQSRGDHERAIELFDAAVSIDEGIDGRPFRFESEKGKLTSYWHERHLEKLDEQIFLTLELAEQHRSSVPDERLRSNFFDSVQEVYDIAARHAHDRGDHVRSFEYSEAASSRSLLDWISGGARARGSTDRDPGETDLLLAADAWPMGINDIRASLPGEMQILQFNVTEDGVLIWLIDREKVVPAFSRIRGDDLADKVREYLQLVRTGAPGEESSARDLYRILIAPMQKALRPGAKICIIPSDSLFRLSFAALVGPDGRRMLEHHELQYAPSSNVFTVATRKAAALADRSGESVLSVGDPAFDPDATFGGLRRLPDAAAEARKVASLYEKSVLLLGDEATAAEFEKAAPGRDVIHFAGHYVVFSRDPLASGLLFASSRAEGETALLPNARLTDLSLEGTKLAVLSACNTAAEDQRPSEGLGGVSRLFLAAGVPLVVGSGWEVDSIATADLMADFHRLRREGQTTTAALRGAQLDMLRSAKVVHRAPRFWAAFAAHGGHANY